MSATLAHENTPTYAPPIPSVPRGSFFPASARAVLLNYLSAAAIILLGLAFYTFVPFYAGYFTPFEHGVLAAAAAGYLIALPVYYATFPDTHPVKCRLFWRAAAAVLSGRRPQPEELIAVRAVGVKAFFMPQMVAGLATNATGYADMLVVPGKLSLYGAILGTFIVTDLFFFTISYGVEHPRLGNEVRSVEPTVLGWAAALACYVPFQLVSISLIGWHQGYDAPFDQPTVRTAAAVLMLGLFGWYAWASASLGMRGGNLTNRGIVSHGPYAWIRHPAYVGKNLFWWGSCTPLLVATAAGNDWAVFAVVVLSLLGWGAIYNLRVITEERHLMRDPEYRAYCERVRYRYIPGVW